MPAPNQRIIYIQRKSDKVRTDYFKIGHEQLRKAANDLKSNAFKLYIYLCDNKDSFRLELSSKDFIAWSGTSDSTYDRAFTQLKDRGYLIKAPDKKNIYLFTEESESYSERHKEDSIILKNKKEIDELFNTKKTQNEPDKEAE